MKRLWAPWRMEFIKNVQKATGCVFCDLPKENEDTKNLIVHRSKRSFVILNRYPYNSGHLLIVPYSHTADFASMDDETLLDVHQEIRNSLQVLQRAMNPQGFNIGMNLGEAGGAGIRDHLHYHIVPRWNGDTNYMPVLGETKILPESLEDTQKRLSTVFTKI